MFFKKKKEPEKTHYLPSGILLYAIGDIHGRKDLLLELHDKIYHDSLQYTNINQAIIVYIGDYVDRGLDSRGVIDEIMKPAISPWQKIYLKGNHEDAMIKFMEEPKQMAAWLEWGGRSTLNSYGIADNQSLQEMADEMKEKIPAEHIEFLCNLPLSFEIGDYFFVHAGAKPGVPLDKQEPEDMMYIRGEFVNSKKRFDKTVIFGHSIFDEAWHYNGRIAIDTGAYASGKLSAVCLYSDQVRFIST